MVGIVRNDFWRQIDVGFYWIMVATKNDHKPTVVSTWRANWDVINRQRLSFILSAWKGKRLWLKTWWKFKEFTECLQFIFDWPLAVKVDSHFHQLQRVSTSLPNNVNICRKWMFTKNGRPSSLVPTRAKYVRRLSSEFIFEEGTQKACNLLLRCVFLNATNLFYGSKGFDIIK